MPPKRIVIVAGNIDGAAEKIIQHLEGTEKAGDVIYFDGWCGGWGASAVLKEVVRRLRSSLGSADTGTAGGLEKIIHVDFSRWQSKRALQKAVAEELELPQEVMALFDQHDEEDDFDGVEQIARGVIPHVRVAIMNELNARRFLVVLHNWSGGYIELREIGVPLIGELSKRVLWTSRGRFWPHVTTWHDEEDHVEELAGLSDVVIFAAFERIKDIDEIFYSILYAEIEEVAKYTGVLETDMILKFFIECVLYRATRANGQDISWESHASNYWVCDGIIIDATDGRSAWEISDALQRNINLDFCNICADYICEMLSGDGWRYSDRWVSLTSQNSMEVEVPSLATSFFSTTVGPSSSTGYNGNMILNAGIFEHSCGTSSLRVIYLSHCTFSFSSPPFLSCSNLRFLLLDHCNDLDKQDHGEENECHHYSHCRQQEGGPCFRKLWVLELSYTDWYWLLSRDMLDVMVDLRELNVKGVDNQSMVHLHRCNGAGSNRRSLIKLRVVAEYSNKSPDNDDGTSGKRNQQVSPPPMVFFPDLSSWHILKTVILDGCGDLEQIDALPLSLESFTFISSVTAINKIKRISFQGCTKLNNLLLRGLFARLEELDMSGTPIKTLDLSATQAWGLKRLFLLGCEELCVILWPQEKNKAIRLEILHIETTTATYVAWNREEGKSNKQEATASDNASISIGSSSSALVCGKDRTIIDSDSYISVRDPRLFRSLVSLRHERYLHVEISSTGPGHKDNGEGINTRGDCASAAANVHKPPGSFYTDDISRQADDANRDAFKALVMKRSKWLWGCPPIPEDSDYAHCNISIQDETQTKLLLQGGTATSTRQQINRATTLPPLVSRNARTLHVHDSLSITCLPGPAPTNDADLNWSCLKWCRIERCPNLEGIVFTASPPRHVSNHIFSRLETFWASQLPKARYICDWSKSGFRPGFTSFEHLVFLHLDYCPRLVHVLPLYTSNTYGCCRLETLEIVCCGDLREVFPSDSKSRQQDYPIYFTGLKRIHLYELPKLQCICGGRMLAPNLETVIVRGCWGLKHLPAVGRRRSTPPVVDCEKDRWDGLEWDGEQEQSDWWLNGPHPSHYKPTYSAYYKKNQLRASVLR